MASPSFAQGFGAIGQNAVGGVSIDPSGVLGNASVDESRRLNQLLAESLKPAAGAMAETSELRKVSLRKLIATVEAAQASGKPVPESAMLLAGMQRIEYVFVDEANKDIILAGPAEGWKIDETGAVVGTTTGKPVLILDDLVVALRTAFAPVRQPLTCSIDPTAQGIQQLQGYVNSLGGRIGNPAQTTANIEQALGSQVITLGGLEGDTHMARVLVAADYRMKRLAMGMEEAPVRGMPNFLQMTSGTGNVFPRWWMTTNYEALLRTEDGNAWQLRGPGVKVMTEDSFFDETGRREQTGRVNPAAQRWADTMTEKFESIAAELPIFGQLRNSMDLAVVGALIAQHQLADRVGLDLSTLTSADKFETTECTTPKSVPSQASVLRKGRTWVISASGGVEINPWSVVAKADVAASLAPTRDAALQGAADQFWWD
jgi:hypothetical protein